MNYLFFDIECANCRESAKICEFGYVLTDENFNILEKNEFIINPEWSFDNYALKKILTYKKADYLSSPPFTAFYDKIKNLLLDENTMVWGHAVMNDAKFLKDSATRYDLGYIDFPYCDVGVVYKKIYNNPEIMSIEKMLASFDEQANDLHNALGDSEKTMLILKDICKQQNASISSLLQICPEAKGRLDLNTKPKKHKSKKNNLAVASVVV